MKKQILTCLLAATFCTSAFASEVTGYTPATSGETATAEAINARFDALISAINDNNARIAELESFSVSGKTYDFKEVSIVVAGGGVAAQFTYSGQAAFASDGTVTFNGTERELETATDDGIPRDTGSGTTQAIATWTQADSAVTVTFPDGFTFDFAVSRGATMFTGIIENFISPEGSVESSISVGTLIDQ